MGRRYFLWLALAFLFGIFYGLRHHISLQFLPSFLWYSTVFLLLCALLFLSVQLFFRKFSAFSADFLFLWFIILSFCLGIFRVSYFENHQFSSLQSFAGKSCQYIGVLTDDPTPSSTEKTLGFPVKVLFLQEKEERIPCKGKVMLYAKPELSSSLKNGQMISFAANLTPPEGASFPGGYSNRDRLYSQGFCFLEYIKELTPLDEVYQPTALDRLRNLGRQLQKSLLASIDKTFGENSRESALLKGILVGFREDFTTEQHRQFTDSGLVHITAVSGMHVMFLTGFLTFLFRKLRLPKFLSVLVLSAVLLLFCAMAAFTPSVCRAVILMLLILLAQLMQREPDSLTSLSAAAVILLMINPYSLTSYSFILSFSSVLGLLLLAQPIQDFLFCPFRQKDMAHQPISQIRRCLHSSLRAVLSSFSVSLACSLGVGYFSARFFRRISWGSLIANLFLLPLSSAAFILGYLNWPLSYLCPEIAGFLAKGPLWLMLWCINQIAAIFSHGIFLISTGTPPESAIIPYLFLLFAIRQSLCRKREKIT